MEAFPYEALRIGVMTVFSYDPDYCRGAVQLTYIRDARNWHRGGDRQVVFPLSEQRGDFDWGAMYPLQSPLVIGDEIWIYYTGYGADHNHDLPPGVDGFPNGIGLAKLRLDDFVSVDAGATEGNVTTKSFTMTGRQLMMNADAHGGRVLVELLDTSGDPIHGYDKADCVAVNGDHVRHTVAWRNNADVRQLDGKAIKLKFHPRKCKALLVLVS